MKYITELAMRGSLRVVVTANGSAHPIRQVNISSELSGTIYKVFVDHNDVVEVGQELAELNTEKLVAALESSRAKLESARVRVADTTASVEERRAEYERKKSLTNIISERDLQFAKFAYDRAVAQNAIALADVDIATAELHLSEINLAKATIRSPVDGIVLKRNVEPGQFVATSLQAPVLFLIAEDLRRMEVRVDVNEVDIGKINVGQKVNFTVSAYPGRKFPAEVHDVRLSSEVAQGATAYKAILRIDNSELLIRPGMTALAEITVQQINDALLVPNAALSFSPPASEGLSELLLRFSLSPPAAPPPTKQEEENQRVWILRDGVPIAVPVVVGASDGRRTEILNDNITPGQAIITNSSTSKR
jgi:HlyD family secretion protein